jgi:hypothetical protein
MAEKAQNPSTTIIKETSDINVSLRLASMLLNDKNYQSWTKAAIISLKGYVNGTRLKFIIPTEIEEWEIQDNSIMSWLLHSMKPQIGEQFVHRTDSSYSMWSNSQRRFDKQDNFVHIFKIKQEISQNKQGNKMFNQLYDDMQRQWDELDILQPNITDP